MTSFMMEFIFAIVIALICMRLITIGKNGSAVSILSLLVGRFLGKSESNRHKGRTTEKDEH